MCSALTDGDMHTMESVLADVSFPVRGRLRFPLETTSRRNRVESQWWYQEVKVRLEYFILS
jgi:hypothetical protein